MDHYKPVFFSCVPTVLSVLLDIPVGDADISSLKYLICGAAPLSVELFKRFEEHSGMKILEGYGLTESTCASCVNPKDGERKVGSIGLRLPYQQVKVMILDENGFYKRDAGIGEIGSVCISGPDGFQGVCGGGAQPRPLGQGGAGSTQAIWGAWTRTAFSGSPGA